LADKSFYGLVYGGFTITEYRIILYDSHNLVCIDVKVLPDAKIKWKHVWIGSLVTTFLFEIGKFALEFYFGKANPGTGYGAAGSVILIMLWVTYSSVIVLFGSEFTHTYANMFSSGVAPTKIAKVEKALKPVKGHKTQYLKL